MHPWGWLDPHLHDGDELLGVILSQLASPLGHRDVGLLQDDVGVPPADTLDRGQGEHHASLALDVRVKDTQDVLEVGRHHQRHGAKVAFYLKRRDS
jgi:hypothetical protein